MANGDPNTFGGADTPSDLEQDSGLENRNPYGEAPPEDIFQSTQRGARDLLENEDRYDGLGNAA